MTAINSIPKEPSLRNAATLRPGLSCPEQRLDVLSPLCLVDAHYPPVVRNQPIHFSLDVGGLRPDSPAACVEGNLVPQKTKQHA